MALHNIRGKEGECLADKYLQNHGYQVQHRNWKHGYYEIDIIATKNNIIHFIEVKTRHSSTFGHPEQGVTKKKFANLKKAAVVFLHLQPYWNRIQFDILSITRLQNQPIEFLLIEDVYI